MTDSQNDSSELREEVIARLRAYRHADTNDIELLATTIERPDGVEIANADHLTRTVADSFVQLITQRDLEQRIDELKGIAGQYGEFRDETLGNPIDIKAVTLYRITSRITELERQLEKEIV